MAEQTDKTEIKQRGRLHFSTSSYPTFGRGAFSENNPPETVLNSPFYWWFMFLRLNEDYRATAAAKGLGKCAELYADFGDIYACDFKLWWNGNKDAEGHAWLFAEPRNDDYVMYVASRQSEIAPFDSDRVLNLVVPLTWSQR